MTDDFDHPPMGSEGVTPAAPLTGAFTVSAPAKLNLSLRITGRRSNGYHELQSVFWPIDLTDRLQLQDRLDLPTDGAAQAPLKVEALWHPSVQASPSLELPQGQANLVAKALQQIGLREWNVRVVKKIPMGAGLGGGSSNAGSVLRALVQRELLSLKKAQAAAECLGADVPFFLDPSPSWVQGVGEDCTPLWATSGQKLPQWYFLLVLPPFGCETAHVFRAYKEMDLELSPTANIFSPIAKAPQTPKELVARMGNDLEPAAIHLQPRLGDILSQMRSCLESDSLYTGMSGSGSTCFAVFNSRQQAEKAAKALERFCREHSCKSVIATTFEVLDEARNERHQVETAEKIFS